ncbi:hypothetical protein BaRGS_00022297 [Batillaria attramentaria]|uniref:ubiquitinyl hydrolase 1 n=1 Tax=Batillaria attramentaria TaxID=370345 RepID=A0ABD0KHF3_9CAEN
METMPPETETESASEAAKGFPEEDGVQKSSNSGKEKDRTSRSYSSSPVFFIGPLANPSAMEAGFGTKDIPDPLAVHGSCGLSNLGNTCFMNAGIQALASCTPLLKFFFEEFEFRENLQGTLTGAFFVLLCKMWSGQYSVIHPRQFKELLGLYHPQFQDYRQHDCQEFLALLLDTFHEQLNKMPSICVTDTSPEKCVVSDTQPLDHLNNQDCTPGSPEKTVQDSTDEVGSGGGLVVKEGDFSSASSQGEISGEAANVLSSSPAEVTHSRNSLKRTSSSPAEAMVAALISEDSNHSSVSVQSTDSEQTSAFKKLKIEPEAAGTSACGPANSQEKACPSDVDTEVTLTVPHLDTGKSSASAEVSYTGDADATAEPMEICQDVDACPSDVRERNVVGGVSLPSSSGMKDPATDCSSSVTEAGEETGVQGSHSGVSPSVPSNTEGAAGHSSDHRSVTLSSSSSSPSTGQACDSQGQTISQDSSQPLACLEDYYCKETKTLNTNVLVSCYSQGDIAIDSEKFAKVDNRSQVPVTKEVNLLQEALHDLDSDKVEKALIGKTLGGKSSNMNTGSSSDKTASTSSNLRVVKTHNSAMVRKPSLDGSLLNNSYEYEDEVLGYDGLMTAAFHKGGEDSVLLGMGCSKSEAEDMATAAKMMEIPEELKPLEVEKNVQMQALSKFKTAMAKSNIREDISDKASTSESTETEDAEMEAEDNPGLLNPARCYTAADVAAANASWESYKSRNNSVVVNTFQGQFKSTVVCSECDHVSVTYEPFMYLSLPIPHAMERQICVVFIQPYTPATRYLVTLHKNDKVQRLRQELQALTGTDTCDIILAEVLDKHISRLLDDNIMLRYINDTSRTIFAFEMLPPPDILKERSSSVESPPPQQQHVPSSNTHSIPSRRPAETCTSQCQENSDLSQPLTIDTSGVGSGESYPERSASPLLSMHELDQMLSGPAGEKTPSAATVTPATATRGEPQSAGSLGRPDTTDPFLAGTGLLEWSQDREFSSSSSLVPEVSPPPCSPLSEHSTPFSTDFMDSQCGTGDGKLQSPVTSAGMEHLPAASNCVASPMWPADAAGDPGPNSSPRGSGLMDQWQICAICLEEMMDSELLTHVSCTGVFCHTCLEMSAKHSGDLAHCCPICLSPVDVTQDFVPLASTSTVKGKVRILAVPITYRSEQQRFMEGDGGCSLELICSPRLLYVASQQDASSLYALIDKVSPFHGTYTLHFTDGQGLRCSRCEYGAHCTGCEIPREGDVTLQPGDNMTVHFTELLPADDVERANQVSDDKSLKHLRSRDPISIFDCFDAFTQSEVLDEHNPWYCPCCRRNQCAKKTMTVWRYPDSLIIHLKRFVYEDLASTKIDNRVVFPHNNLDVTRFLAGPPMSFNVYDLHSIVCHYGGANSGHYTSFTCHPLTNEWYNYNDETVTQQKPGDSEFDSGYVLFYRRQGMNVEFSLVKELPFTEDDTSTGTSGSASHYQPPPSSPATAITLDMESLPLGDSDLPRMADTDNYDFYN